MDRLTIDTDGKSGVGLTFDLDVKCPNMDTAERLQDLIVRLGQLEKAVSDANRHYDINRLRELAAADCDGRVVVLPCKVGNLLSKLENIQNSAEDAAETYTTGYRNGHRNGQAELIRYILGTGTGSVSEAEAALKEQEAQP